jgi:hypothetical protein
MYENPFDTINKEIRKAAEQAGRDEKEFYQDMTLNNLKNTFMNLLSLLLDKGIITAEEIEHKIFEGK